MPDNLEEVVQAVERLRPALTRLILAREERRRAGGTGGERLSTPQHLALGAIAERTLTTSELAARTGVAVSTATRMIQGLERAGLVEPADVGDEDRRRRYARLTPAGDDALRQADEAARLRVRDLLTALSLRERAVLLEALTVLTEALRAQETLEEARLPA